MDAPMTIAIDGPAAAGKSTIAKTLAGRLGIVYVDTGALYRAIGYFAVSHGKDPKCAEQVVPLLEKISLQIVYQDGAQHILLNGQDVSKEIRSPQMSMAASAVSAIPQVREFLLELQRETARKQSVVMDGRDIGTVVLPQAKLKIFLTATAEERARRRYLEYQQRGETVDYETLLAQTKERDKNDSTRAAAPLRQAPDAVLVDSTHLTLEEVTEQIYELAKERMA